MLLRTRNAVGDGTCEECVAYSYPDDEGKTCIVDECDERSIILTSGQFFILCPVLRQCKQIKSFLEPAFLELFCTSQFRAPVTRESQNRRGT